MEGPRDEGQTLFRIPLDLAKEVSLGRILDEQDRS